MQPNLRGSLQGAWRLLKAWHVNEVPNRAPPLPEHILQAMVGWSFSNGHFTFGISLLLAFYTMLRTGEVLGLRGVHLLSQPSEKQVLVSLGLTKSGKRQGAAESVILGYEPAVKLVKHWKSLSKSTTPLANSPSSWRSLFNRCLEAIHVTQCGFRPYSLRRGGATFWSSKHHSLDRILLQGRWQNQKSARIYLNEGLSMLTSLNIPASSPYLKPYITFFTQSVARPSFKTLEPPVKTGRTGGRGTSFKRGHKGAKETFFFSSRILRFTCLTYLLSFTFH